MKTPRIEHLNQKTLVGKKLTMSLSQNRTQELWQSFMPNRSRVTNRITRDYISLQLYDADHFKKFDPNKKFVKWAAVEVLDLADIPDDMQSMILESGMYAVFDHKGSSADSGIFQYIYGTWLPASEFNLDHRPHFEVLGEHYKPNDPNSEEEIWIPIVPK